MSDRWMRLIEDPNPWVAPRPLPPPVTTPRLVVRLYRKGDGRSLFEAIDGNRKSLLPWMAWALTDHQDADDSIHYVERSRREVEKPDSTNFSMGIFDRESGELIGGTGLHRIRPARREAEIGYWVRGDRQGRGCCTESTAGLISAALTPASDGGWGFRRIVVYNAADNVASRRVCEKLGLRLESHEKEDSYLERPEEPGAPAYHDTFGFGVLMNEWDFRNHRAKAGIQWESRG